MEVTGAGEKLTERYYECGIETVQQSQLLLALWDGEPSQGLGGTADMVHFAKEQGTAGHLDPQRYRRGASISMRVRKS